MPDPKTEALQLARDALDEIALAGMSGTGDESPEAMTAWHARRAREFIGIAARALDPIRAALAATSVPAESVEWPRTPGEIVARDLGFAHGSSLSATLATSAPAQPSAIESLPTYRPVWLQFGVSMHKDVRIEASGWLRRSDVIDALATSAPSEPVRAMAEAAKEVELISDAFKAWGGWSGTPATCERLHHLLTHSGRAWARLSYDYAQLVSAQPAPAVPVAAELTDEEIDRTTRDHGMWSFAITMRDFARRILAASKERAS